MLGEDLDAAFRVGYEDPSYFSGDYKRLSALRRNATSQGSEAASQPNIFYKLHVRENKTRVAERVSNGPIFQ